MTHGNSKLLMVSNSRNSPAKPSAPQRDMDDRTTKEDTAKSNSVKGTTETSPFHTANESTNLYPLLSTNSLNTSRSYKTADQHLEGSRKRHSDGSSVLGDKKPKTPTTQQSQSWFSHILRK